MTRLFVIPNNVRSGLPIPWSVSLPKVPFAMLNEPSVISDSEYYFLLLWWEIITTRLRLKFAKLLVKIFYDHYQDEFIIIYEYIIICYQYYTKRNQFLLHVKFIGIWLINVQISHWHESEIEFPLCSFGCPLKIYNSENC